MFNTVLASGGDAPVGIIAIMGGIAIVAILSSMIKSVIQTKSRERTRREIAAYIAEGSMTPDQGERLLKAEPDKNSRSC